jgi:hypothetical protein
VNSLISSKSWTKRLLPSPVELIFILIFLRLVFSSGILLIDGDTGYHIRAGDFILKSFSIPKYDIFSLWMPPLPWTAHEWLSEVVMSLVHRYSGLTGIVIFFALIIAMTYVLLFKMLRESTSDILLALLLAATAAICSSLHWLARPHIFSLALTVLWYSILNRFQYQGRQQLYLLPALTLVWVNLHAGYIFGLLLLLLYAAGNLAAWCFAERLKAEQHVDKIKSLATVLIVCLAVSLLNPQGYRMLIFPFALTADTFIMDHVREFLSPDFHKPLPFKYLLLASIGLFAFSRATLNWIELGLVSLVTYMALYSARYIPLYAIITAPIFLRLLDKLKAELRPRASEWLAQRSVNFSIIAECSRGYVWSTIIIVSVLVTARIGVLRADFDSKDFPRAAVDFLKTEKIPGNMFNNDEFGDYLIYTAWPEYRVFFDGRSDMYGSVLGRDYERVSRTLPGWQEVLEKHRVTWVFFNTYSPLSSQLKIHPDWHLIYSDAVASIFVKDEAEHQRLIAKYASVPRLPSARRD